MNAKRLASCAAIMMALAIQALAQPLDEDDPIEEVVVTGTYFKGRQQFRSPSPVTVLGRDDIASQGVFTIDDLTDNLTTNTGAQNNADAFTQSFSTGTNNVNLRGLGVSSTLVLLNGRRQVQSTASTDRGENFVDTASLLPLIAVERIETVRDGATALYGSDAVAGVVNFITRSDFRGLELQTGYQGTTEDDQEDLELAMIWGSGNASTDLIFAFSYLDREPLTTRDRPLPMSEDISIFGQPGSFITPTVPQGPNPLTSLVWSLAFDANNNGVADFFEGLSPLLPVLADPACPLIAAEDANISAPETFPAGFCTFDFGPFFNVVPEERRVSAFAELNQDINENWRFRSELGFANNDAERGNPPSVPIFALPPISGAHPNNPFGADVLMVGRAVGAFGEPNVSTHDNQTWRVAAELERTWADSSWTLALTYSDTETEVAAGDTLADRFFAALAGFGGPANNQFFNPFGSRYFDAPNDPAVIEDFTGRVNILGEAEQLTLETVYVRDLFAMRGGNAGLALGAHYRDEDIAYTFDENASTDNFLFFVGNPSFRANRDVVAGFAELALPFTTNLEAQVALRYEDYGDVDSVDHKLSFIWRPHDEFTLRASGGSAFRAPSLAQAFGSQTVLQQLIDPLNPGLAFRAVRSRANPDVPLQPESADAYNIGASFAFGAGWELNLDYWRFDYEDMIVQESAQALLFADPTGPQIVRDPTTGLLSRVNTFYTNAAALETDGVDLSLRKPWDSDYGRFAFTFDTTWVASYDIVDPQAGRIDGVGNRNFTNFATSVPEWRANTGLSWTHGRHGANGFVRYIDSYQDDQNGDANIDSHATLDLQYSYQTAPFGLLKNGVLVTVGAINALDEEVPGVQTNGGYDTKVHDPRGRLIYLRGSFGFE